MNKAGSSVICPDWNSSDPDLEKSIVEALDGLILCTSFEIEEHVEGWRLNTFDQIGGPGTLREIWNRIKNLGQVVGIKRKLTESLSSNNTSCEDKEKIDDFITAGIDGELEDWISKAGDLMEKLSIHGEVNNDLRGVDLDPQVGSEPDLENIRSDCKSDTQEDLEREEVGREEDSFDIPNLTPATISSCESDGDSSYNFKGGMMDGKMVDFTNDSKFEVASTTQDGDTEDEILVMKEIVDTNANTGEKEGEDTDWDSDEWKEYVGPESRDGCWSSWSDGSGANDFKLEDVFSFERDISMPSQRWESEDEDIPRNIGIGNSNEKQ